MNRTHRGRGTPPIGFEDRERHQATDYSPIKQVNLIYQLDFTDSSLFISARVLRLNDSTRLLHRFDCFEHI